MTTTDERVTTRTTDTWVAIGPAGAVGSIHRTEAGFRVALYGREDRHASYPTLESAKRAVHAALGPLAERPEFRAH
ncbi:MULTISPECIES: methyltransferase [unclassified Curtobacterium]|uniref:methyltransferase n=1 Tax=unclassified Curtobacterium TaxID=257496 RepID=UPI000DA78816|nr:MULTISPECIES: methyltransferase [unclassified Curtobacterium]PZE25618.1 methyltransferase [Curtobacterium sp. MCBD17_028]PZE78512.1 methyltransferase [Curtobacterium sp. MCBD17_019]PZF57103.1 methyltransferase [Curtobacterium sp. MCBD17_034]PZF63256.1 methyltransferase [Curtobacterium sp. MCBD17_013]PZM33547.1 methyltransferase [Curtobacterium sp. MCBD17_031]